MKSIAGLVLLLLFAFTVQAQDLVLTPIGADVPCMPGVINKSPGKGLMVSFGQAAPSTNWNNNALPDQDARLNVNRRFKSKIKIPLINKPNLKFMIGWNYYRERFDFSHLDPMSQVILSSIDDQSLKSSRLSAYMIYSIDSRHYLGIKAVASYNGDYQGAFNFDKRYTQYNLAILYGTKRDAYNEWGAGLLIRRSFVNNFPVLPFVTYNKTFNRHWGFEGTLPVNARLRYNINEKQLFMFGPQFESRTYSIDVMAADGKSGTEFHMRRAELQLTLSYQHNVAPWVWIEAAGGYSHNFTTRFELPENAGSSADFQALMLQPSNGVFFRLGLFVTPPRKHFQK